MLYNSFTFLLFFPTVTFLYYLVPQAWKRWYLLIISYLFYMNWHPAYALLLAFVTLVTFYGARQIVSKSGENKSGGVLLTVILIFSFAGLFVFKYLNFINESVWNLLSVMGCRLEMPHWDLLLPVGISFYTFQACGYVIDVYKKKIEVEKDLGYYALFVSFFPQIAAGPIGRAGQLLPQFKAQRFFKPENITRGLKWMLWGYFMKVVVADRLALYTDAVFGNIGHHSGVSVMVAAVFFTIQIYCDFAGYSFIALGCARAMGYNLTVNFERPYMAQSVQDFWRRWHISLSTWFRDYLYIPLGGSRCGKWRTRLNLMITFIVSGLWHGANWTFVIWGGLNGLFQVAGNLMKPWKQKLKTVCRQEDDSEVLKIFNIVVTFILMTVAWTFFKAHTFADACMAIRKMILPTGTLYKSDTSTLLYCIVGIIIVMCSDIIEERNGRHPLLENKNPFLRFASYLLLATLIMCMGVFDGGQFIYFKF
ncbi:MAG: MBOAT family protein [Clostridium sp.]|nr:MBOAT family protein [Clostridium sp.]